MLFFRACLRETRSTRHSIYRSEIDVVHGARGANRLALPRCCERVAAFWSSRLRRRFRTRALPPLRIRLDRHKVANSNRADARFAPRGRGLRSFGAGTGPSIRAVGLDFGVARQCLPLARGVSIT
jgi:hypothetical protein